MALLRAELKGMGRLNYRKQTGGEPEAAVTGVYEGIVEAIDDLALSRLESCDSGSLLYCLENGGVYVKNSQGSWVALPA